MKIRLSLFGRPAVLPALLFAGIFIIIAAHPLIAQAQARSSMSAGNIVALANEDRAARGLRPLIEDSRLSAAAQKKANDMARRGYFSHIDPGGDAPWKWFTSVGFYYTFAAENLGMNFTDARALEKAWMLSPSHKANIMSQRTTRVGIGIAKGRYRGKTTTFVVQFFARPAAFATNVTRS